MKAKEKAEELIKKYEKTLDRELLPINDKDCFHSAKRCALIAVNEIKESLKSNIEYPKIILLLDYTEIEVEDYE